MRRLKFIFFLLITAPLIAQTEADLFDRLDGWADESREGAGKTFRGTRIVNMQSVENPFEGEMIFTIGHRFGSISSGFYEMFGLDLATIRLGFDYGINSWLGAGVGRSTFEKTWDGYLKAVALDQEGRLGSPVTVAWYVSPSQATLRLVYPPDRDNFAGRLTVVQKVMIARKFSEIFSLQVSPVWLHSDYLREVQLPADLYYLGTAARIRVTPMTHINLEYIHGLNEGVPGSTNPLSVGFDLETGGHVFQLFLSNTQGIHDKAYLVNTRGRWDDGDLFFGFTITRVFYLQ